MKSLKMLCWVGLIVALSLSMVVSISESQELALKVGTNAEYPPFEYKENEEFKGVDMDLVRLIGEKMGAKIEIMDMDFDSLIPSLLANKVDMVLAAMTITEERKNQVDFSNPYYSANQAIVVQAKSDITVNAEEELAKYIIGSQNGTTGQIYIDENFVDTKKLKKSDFRKYPTNIEALTDLLNGNLDMVIIDDSAANGYSKLKPIKTIFVIETGESYGIAFPKNSPHLQKVNEVLEQILNSEEWTKLLEKYL